MNKKEKLTRLLERSEKVLKEANEVNDEIKKDLADLDKPEVIYSIGDRFKQKNGKEKRIIVAVAGIGESFCEDYVMWSNLRNGHGSSVKVKHWNRITPEEMAANLNNFNEYVRYWDNRKQEYTDGRNAEDLEEFQIKNGPYKPIKVEIIPLGLIKIGDGDGYVIIHESETTAFHQKPPSIVPLSPTLPDILNWRGLPMCCLGSNAMPLP